MLQNQIQNKKDFGPDIFYDADNIGPILIKVLSQYKTRCIRYNNNLSRLCLLSRVAPPPPTVLSSAPAQPLWDQHLSSAQIRTQHPSEHIPALPKINNLSEEKKSYVYCFNYLM